MKLQQWIKQNQLGLLSQQGSFGLEKESQRIDKNGNIVTTPHPAVFGNRAYHPYIQTDFAESQLELITPPNNKLEDLCLNRNSFSRSVCQQACRLKVRFKKLSLITWET